MRKQRYFIDSSIWLYRFMIDPNSSETEDEKQKCKKAINITDYSKVVVSTQVISEVCSILLKNNTFTEDKIKDVIHYFYRRRFKVIKLNKNILIKASKLQNQYNFSFWDSLIVASALAVNSNIFYSEIMQKEFVINKQHTIVNPFNRQQCLKLSLNSLKLSTLLFEEVNV